jgi:hypothetical protein
MASFKQLTASDFVISSDSVSGTLWSTGNPTLATFFTSSTQAASSAGDYYFQYIKQLPQNHQQLFNMT